MKFIIVATVCVIIFAITVAAQNADDGQPLQEKEAPFKTVEASCGQCNFGLSGKGCDLAVRIDGKAYFVDGTVDGSNIDDHGDAHGPDGFCITIRKASVKGSITGDRFKLEHFKLLPK